MNEKAQEIKCFCGCNIPFDWSAVPVDTKMIYVRCSKCDTEIKLKNPYFRKEGDK